MRERFDEAWLTHTLSKGAVRVVQGAGDASGSEVPPPSTRPAMISHTAFRTAIVRLATQYGWKSYYTQNARKSPRGFPDLVLARAGEPVLYAELKIPPDTLSIEQDQWLKVLRRAVATEVYVWAPAAWSQIAARLTRHERSPRETCKT